MGKLSPSRCFALQNASIPAMDGTPASEPNRTGDSWNASTAAALCAGMPPRYYLAAKVRFGQSWADCDALGRYLYVEAAGLAHHERWVVAIGQGTIRSLSELAVAEFADPARYGNDVARVIWFAGCVKLEEHRMWAVWDRTWKSRYNQMYMILERWSDYASSHVWRKQIDESDEGEDSV